MRDLFSLPDPVVVNTDQCSTNVRPDTHPIEASHLHLTYSVPTYSSKVMCTVTQWLFMMRNDFFLDFYIKREDGYSQRFVEPRTQGSVCAIRKKKCFMH